MPGVTAVPGDGSRVPLYILGSSLFGAKLAAAPGLPYAFASHSAPAALEAAIAAYRSEFRPSEQLETPYVIAGVNVIAADTTSAAREQLAIIRRRRAVSLYARQVGLRDLDIADGEAEQLLAAGLAAPVDEMLTYTAVGTPPDVQTYLESFRRHTRADELMVVRQAATVEGRLRSVVLLGEAMLGVSAA